MSMEVLQNRQQISDARRELVSRGLSAVPGTIETKAKQIATRLRLGNPLIMGDFVKSWDVLRTVQFLEDKLQKNDPVLDIGCYASEILVSLHHAGFTNLAGVDLNPRLQNMPDFGSIRYVEANFMHTPFEDASFNAVTSISVIEHGFNPAELAREMGRILKPGGYFVASFDYWPDKVDTGDTRYFNMDWLIFSKEDVASFLVEAEKHGLYPAGDMSFTAQDRAIEHGGYHYTFGWLVLQKRT